jgi:hypothetical protein
MTAVEWYNLKVIELMTQREQANINVLEFRNQLDLLFKQTLEIQKQQIENAFNAGVNSEDYYYPNSMFTESETYYNETYKKDNI